jgi:hypothetical protein
MSKKMKILKMKLLKDIVIPAGTIFQQRFGTTDYGGGDMYQEIFGLTDDTSGYVTYGIDSGDPKIAEWFEEVV